MTVRFFGLPPIEQDELKIKDQKKLPKDAPIGVEKINEEAMQKEIEAEKRKKLERDKLNGTTPKKEPEEKKVEV